MTLKLDRTGINYNFTKEQEIKFNLILDDTKKLYPTLIYDDISKERIYTLIAYAVINGDLPIEKQNKENKEDDNNVFSEIE